jgi:exosortase F-associated protein
MKTRIVIACIGVLILAVTYMYQYSDVLVIISQQQFSPEAHFVVNRVFRIILNDIGMILIIYAIFLEADVIKLALLIQIIDLFFLLPIYLLLKLPGEGITELSNPYLSQLHRLIVNPVLMILLIPGIFFQRFTSKSRN